MSAITGLTLSVTNTSTLTGGANITGTTNTNQLNIINNSSFSQSGSGTFSTGLGAVTLNGPVICSSTSSFTGLATFNGSILLPSGKTLTLPTGRVFSNTNDVVDTTSGQTVAGVKTFSNQIVANGGVNAGSNSITCGSLTCSSENDTGALTVGGLLTANGGLTVNSTKTLTLPSTRAITSSNDVVDTTSGQTVAGVKTFSNQIVANGGIDAGSNSITCGGLNSATNINVTGYGTTNLLQYSNGQLYFTNNNSSGASSANGNAGFNFRNYYTGGLYQNFLLINDKTDGTNYYNNNVLPIYASGGLVVPSSKTISSTTDLYFTATNGENIMKLGGDNSSEILQLYKNSVGNANNQGNSYMSIRQDMGSDQGIIVGIDASSFSQFNAHAYIDTIRGGVSGNTPLNLKVCGSIVMQLFSTGVNILNGSTSSNSVLQILPQSTYTQINCTNGSNSLTQPLVLNNNNGYGVCINTSTPQSGYQLTVNGSIYTNSNLTVNGTFSPTSVSTSGVISANGGITMGSNQNITLASTVTTPTSGQLGYTITGTNTLGSITSGTSTNWSSISLPVGTWLLRGKVSATASGGTVTVASVGSNLAPASSGTFSVNNNTSSITTGLTACLVTETNVVNVTSATTYYWYGFVTFSGGGLTTSSTTGGIGSSTYLTATRIA